MKKWIIPVLLFLGSASLCGCVKEYTCQCVTMYSGSSSGFEGEIKVKSKKNGTEACQSKNTTTANSTTQCALK